MRPEHIERFVVALEDEFYIDKQMIAESIQHNSSSNIIQREIMFKVDVLIVRIKLFNS